MKSVTEEYIKSILDGTFTRITGDGKVVTSEFGSESDSGITRFRKLTWAPEEDEVIVQMRFRNRPWSEIAWVTSRSEDAVKKRHRLIRASRGGSMLVSAKEA